LHEKATTNLCGHRVQSARFLPCRLARSSRGLEAAPLPWTGSSDLLGFAGAGGLLALPAGGKRYEPGEEVEVVLRD
jgi:molybdopterin biosynthesis enzyme